jgi:hypothetical protein
MWYTYFFFLEKKVILFIQKEQNYIIIGVKSTIQSWVENPKGTQSNWLESQKEKTWVDRNP